MLRFLRSTLFVAGLFAAGTASAFTATSWEVPPVGPHFGESLHLTSNGIEIVAPPQLLALSVAGPFDLPRIRETLRSSRLERLQLFGAWVSQLPELPLLRDWHHAPRHSVGDLPASVIPEPGTAVLIGMGLVGVGLWRRGRR